MHFYFFLIKDKTINKLQRAPIGKVDEYKLNEKSFGGVKVYYRKTNDKIESTMCEADDPKSAKRAVEQFLLSL